MLTMPALLILPRQYSSTTCSLARKFKYLSVEGYRHDSTLSKVAYPPPIHSIAHDIGMRVVNMLRC